MRVVLPIALLCALASWDASAASSHVQDVAARARAARTVVLAEVEELRPRFDQNKHGDHLIVSDVYVRVEEAWKGAQPAALIITTVEGGTIGELSLTVSDMPVLKPGERAVLFLDETSPGRYALRNRGKGALKVRNNKVEGTDLTLDDIRGIAKAANR